jgi:hypothetical protein
VRLLLGGLAHSDILPNSPPVAAPAPSASGMRENQAVQVTNVTDGEIGAEGSGPGGGAGREQRGEADAVAVAAVDIARRAAEDVAGSDAVGDHVEAVPEGERAVTHYFACTSRGYRGWRWAVTVARASRARTATVCEVCLLPGPDSVLAPAWVPWSERIAPGDLGAGDVLPYREDDPNLEPGYTSVGEEEADQLAIWELGLGRARVLGRMGRDAAAARWYAGSNGPTADVAVSAPAACATCGYFVPLAGALRLLFGVCANEWSPSDGRVVSVDHGCGAHSEIDLEPSEAQRLPSPVLDEMGAEPVAVPSRQGEASDDVPPDDGAPEGASEAAPESVAESVAEEVAESETEEAAGEQPTEAVAEPVSPVDEQPAEAAAEPASVDEQAAEAASAAAVEEAQAPDEGPASATPGGVDEQAQAPAEELPVSETPGGVDEQAQAPAEELPVSETPGEVDEQAQAPAEELPVSETPGEVDEPAQAPAEELPVSETPEGAQGTQP